jgi:hypothetical protein
MAKSFCRVGKLLQWLAKIARWVTMSLACSEAQAHCLHYGRIAPPLAASIATAESGFNPLQYGGANL